MLSTANGSIEDIPAMLSTADGGIDDIYQQCYLLLGLNIFLNTFVSFTL